MYRSQENGAASWGIMASVWIALTLSFFTLLELLSALVLLAVERTAPPALEALTDAQLAALYSTSDPADPAEVRAVLNEGWGRGFHFAYAPFVEMRMAPYRGRHVNISPDGFRLNAATDSPKLADAAQAIFVLGGSTTLGVGVSDSETIPAFLEQALRRSGDATTRVVNFAVSSYFSTQERIQLEQLLRQGLRPRGVVMIDGLNDFYACEYPDRSEVSSLLERGALLSTSESLVRALAAASRTVALWRVLRGEGSPFATLGGKHCGNDEVALDRVIQRLTTNWEIVRALGRSFQFNARFVVQPVPTFHYDNARRPVPELARSLAYHMNSGPGYQRMVGRRAVGELSAGDILWLQELSIKSNQYIDAVHYSPAFNRAIAEAIAAAVGEW